MQWVVKFEDLNDEPEVMGELFNASGLSPFDVKNSRQNASKSSYMTQVPYVAKSANRLIDEPSFAVIRDSGSYRLLIEKLCGRLLGQCQFKCIRPREGLCVIHHFVFSGP